MWKPQITLEKTVFLSPQQMITRTLARSLISRIVQEIRALWHTLQTLSSQLCLNSIEKLTKISKRLVHLKQSYGSPFYCKCQAKVAEPLSFSSIFVCPVQGSSPGSWWSETGLPITTQTVGVLSLFSSRQFVHWRNDDGPAGGGGFLAAFLWISAPAGKSAESSPWKRIRLVQVASRSAECENGGHFVKPTSCTVVNKSWSTFYFDIAKWRSVQTSTTHTARYYNIDLPK